MRHEAEGVTKYELDFHPAPAPERQDIARLNAWRRLLHTLGVVGSDPARYDGLGFGNLSRRLSTGHGDTGEPAFLVTGTQTGKLKTLGPEHYTTVTFCNPRTNHLTAEGPARPSSEAMTHGALYAADSDIRWIFHVHDPHIWQRAEALGVAITDPNIPYGTPAMAEEVARVQRRAGEASGGILAMGGHEDGVLAWGTSDEAAGSRLLSSLARAFAMEELQ